MKNKAVNQKIKAKQKFQIKSIQKRKSIDWINDKHKFEARPKGILCNTEISENMKEKLKSWKKWESQMHTPK